MIELEKHLNFAGQDWYILKKWLEEAKENKIGLLITADTHDKSNQIRGALSIIQTLLKMEEAALRAAQQG